MRIKRTPILLGLADGTMLADRVTGALRDAIAGRRLLAGDALPSSRDLASQLGVARNTVLAATARLVEEGLLETRPGAGTFVRGESPGAARSPPSALAPPDLSQWAERLPDDPNIWKTRSDILDLQPGLPDLSAIPFDEWRRSAMRKLRSLRIRLASYGPPEGHADLRREIARYVARSRGVLCDADDVLVTSGAQQAFDLIARVLVRPGTEVAVEDPGYPPATRAFAAGGAVLRGIPVDGEGLDVASIPGGVTLVYTTPSHQFPLGVKLSDERRRALLAWASDSRALVVEDDYDSEFRFTSDALPALKSADPDGQVIYVGTFSKSLMPGIRLGYMVVPRRMYRVFVSAKCMSDVHSENITQAVLTEFMACGAFGRHVTRMRHLYGERHRALVRRGAAFQAVGASLLPNQGGLHACLVLSTRRREEDLISAAASEGIGLCGLRDFFVSRPSYPGLVVGFGNVDARRFGTALDQVLDLLGQDRPR